MMHILLPAYLDMETSNMHDVVHSNIAQILGFGTAECKYSTLSKIGITGD